MAEQNDARPGDGTETPADQPRPAGACPFLGLADDASAHFDFPSSEHRCRAAAPAYVELAHQGTYCLTERHVTCARYTGPDAAPAPPVPWAFAAAPRVPAAPSGGPAAPPGGPATQPPSAGRSAYPLAARGGFGALASTPRGWVPVETSSPGPTPVPAAAAAPSGAEPGPGAPAEQAPDAGAGTTPGAAPAEPPDAGAPPSTGTDVDEGADPEGLGALVTGAAIVAATQEGDGGTGPGPIVTQPGASAILEGAAADDGAAGGTEAAGDAGEAGGPATEPGAASSSATIALEGPAALEGAGATTAMTARIAALGRGVLRAVVILAAVVLVLAALVGVGYVAGKLLVRPGESLPATVPSAPPVTPGVAVPTPVGSGQPDASAGGSPSVPGGSGPPAPSATAPATDPPTPTPKPTPRPTPKPRVYVVKSGDTLFAIAERFGVTVNAIIEANDIADPNAIYTGQRLTIPRP